MLSDVFILNPGNVIFISRDTALNVRIDSNGNDYNLEYIPSETSPLTFI